MKTMKFTSESHQLVFVFRVQFLNSLVTDYIFIYLFLCFSKYDASTMIQRLP
jgi:hypothetical protein